MLTMAKGVTSAYVPLGGVLVSKAICDHFETRPLLTGLTYALSTLSFDDVNHLTSLLMGRYNSHSVGCAAAVATIQAYLDDKMIENVRAMSKILNEELLKIKDKHSSVGDVSLSARSIILLGFDTR